MKPKLFILALLLLSIKFSFAGEPADSLEVLLAKMDSIESSFKFQTGKIELGSKLATLNIPAGFKFLDKEQGEKVIYDLWGNRKTDDNLLGVIFPENGKILESETWAFVVSFEDIGYVKDGDADDFDYDDMMKQLKKDTEAENPERVKLGYEPYHVIGWAEKPYYDKQKKVLYWAKEIKFGEDSINTLNYDVRVLGRKGILSLNAVGSINQLADVNKKKADILSMVEFSEGSRYSDYDSGVDKVAAWTIGGLVAGKVLAKVGIFALILKNIKLVILALAAFGGGIWKFITGRRKKKEEQLAYQPAASGNTEEPGTPSV